MNVSEGVCTTRHFLTIPSCFFETSLDVINDSSVERIMIALSDSLNKKTFNIEKRFAVFYASVRLRNMVPLFGSVLKHVGKR